MKTTYDIRDNAAEITKTLHLWVRTIIPHNFYRYKRAYCSIDTYIHQSVDSQKIYYIYIYHDDNVFNVNTGSQKIHSIFWFRTIIPHNFYRYIQQFHHTLIRNKYITQILLNPIKWPRTRQKQSLTRYHNSVKLARSQRKCTYLRWKRTKRKALFNHPIWKRKRRNYYRSFHTTFDSYFIIIIRK